MSAAANALKPPSRIRQFNALTKPRVIQLIVFCALIGMVLAVPGVPGIPKKTFKLIMDLIYSMERHGPERDRPSAASRRKTMHDRCHLWYRHRRKGN